MADDENDEAAWSAPDSDPPDHRCGFELLPADVGAEEYFQNLSQWREERETASCCRETIVNGRCRWHADVDADVMRESVATRDDRAQNLDGVLLRGVELEDGVSFEACRLRGATFDSVSARQVDFSNADLSSAEFPDADLYKAEFPNADLYKAEFPNADLQSADFPDADLRDANFSAEHPSDDEDGDSDGENQNHTNADHDPTNLENAVLQNTDLRGADFTDARLDQADLSDARINTETTFDSETIYERDQDIESRIERAEESPPPPGAWVQRRLERLHDENALSTTARKFHVRKQRAKQTHYAQRREWSLSTLDDWVQWGRLVTYENVMGYGENPWRVGLTALVIVLLWAVAYPFGGWVRPVEESQPLSYPDPTTADSALAFYSGVWQTFLDSLYFSGVTFTTLGFGDFRPVGFGRLLATAEAGLGVTLFAILVFVLGRRVAR